MAFPSSSRNKQGTVCTVALALVIVAMLLGSCHSPRSRGGTPPPAPAGDEIIVAGQRFHTGTRVITWLDPGGYDAYRGQPPLTPRAMALGPKGSKPDRKLAALQKIVDQFVLHYDGSGLSKVCFNILRTRGLSVHFLLDVDGTVYQTLDLQERASHATIANDRSIGIEIANIGAYPPTETKLLDEWYHRDAQGQPRLTIPGKTGDPGIRTTGFIGRPARPAPVRGVLQGQALVQYDFTPEQYEALARLTAALCRVFPKITCDYPHDASGRLITRKLSDETLVKYQGVLGHYHIQENKIDPGPALQWNRIIKPPRP